jgi:hypothetical protein
MVKPIAREMFVFANNAIPANTAIPLLIPGDEPTVNVVNGVIESGQLGDDDVWMDKSRSVNSIRTLPTSTAYETIANSSAMP